MARVESATRPGPVTVASVCRRLDALLAEIRAIRAALAPAPPGRR